ncbi:MAG: DUF86 domain-containing protein [Methanothrix sp.]|nr:DUF86 domain-containing protein [Methanothrix sp.]
MNRDERIILLDIIFSIGLIKDYTRDITKDDFMKNVPEDFRSQHPDVPWKLVAGLRDVLIHGYFTVNLGRVWLFVKQDLPELEVQIAQIMDNLD